MNPFTNTGIEGRRKEPNEMSLIQFYYRTFDQEGHQIDRDESAICVRIEKSLIKSSNASAKNLSKTYEKCNLGS